MFVPTILILEKLTRPSSVKLGVPSSMKARSVRYIPRYGTHGGLQLQGDIKKIKTLIPFHLFLYLWYI